MLKIRYITKMRIQTSHDLNNVFRRFVSLSPVFDNLCLINKFLQMAAVFRNNQMLSFRIVFQIKDYIVGVFFFIFFGHIYSEIIPSMVDTSRYLSITCCGLFISTSTDMLVNLPVLDLVVLITAPMQSNAFSTLAMLSCIDGTINLYKYSDGHVVLASSPAFNLT